MGGNMLGMLLIFGAIFAHQAETILVRNYGKKHGAGGFFFNAIICFAALFYFFITDKGGLNFPPKLWLYGIINASMYAIGYYTGYVAYSTGSYALTKLFMSFGILISIFYGIVFLGEPATVLTYISFALILAALALANYRKKEADDKITVKWLINIIFMVASNAAISIIGKMQHGTFDGDFKNEFLIISLAGATVMLFAFGFIFERDSLKKTFKYGLMYGGGAGVLSGINNLATLGVYAYLPISVVSPVKSGLNMVLSFLTAVLLYKEKFSKRQVVGVALGILAIVLINL